MQRLEQLILGIGTDNGLYREVRLIRLELAQVFDEIRELLAREREERIGGDTREATAREGQWSSLYFRGASWIIGLVGLAVVGLLVAVLTR